MTINELHKITGDLIAEGRGTDDVAVDVDAFIEGDSGENLVPVEAAKLENVKRAGLMDDEEKEVIEHYLVLRGI